MKLWQLRKTAADGYVEPARAAISLKRKKFYGGVNIDKHGSYSITKDPNSTDFFTPPSPKLDAAWREEMLLSKHTSFK